jgi:hypothetical protein
MGFQILSPIQAGAPLGLFTYTLACEYVQLLHAPLAKFYVFVTPVGRFQGRLAG